MPLPQRPPTRLEPVFLANVLLYTPQRSLRSFIAVSKNTREATLMLRTNPPFAVLPALETGFDKLLDMLLFFPNITTVHIPSLACLDYVAFLPPSVLFLVVDSPCPIDSLLKQPPAALSRITHATVLTSPETPAVHLNRLSSISRLHLLLHRHIPVLLPRKKIALLRVSLLSEDATSLLNEFILNKDIDRLVVQVPTALYIAHQRTWSRLTDVQFALTDFSGTLFPTIPWVCLPSATHYSITSPSNIADYMRLLFPASVAVQTHDPIDLSRFTCITSIINASSVPIVSPPSLLHLDSSLPPPSPVASLVYRGHDPLPTSPILTALTCFSSRCLARTPHLDGLLSLSLSNVSLSSSLVSFSRLTAVTLSSCTLSFTPTPSPAHPVFPSSLSTLSLETCPTSFTDQLARLSSLRALTNIQMNAPPSSSLDLAQNTSLTALVLHTPSSVLLPTSLRSLALYNVQHDLDLAAMTTLTAASLQVRSRRIALPPSLRCLCFAKGFGTIQGLADLPIRSLEVNSPHFNTASLPTSLHRLFLHSIKVPPSFPDRFPFLEECVSHYLSVSSK